MTYVQAQALLKLGRNVGNNRFKFDYGPEVYMFLDSEGHIRLHRNHDKRPIPVFLTEGWYLMP